MKPFAWLIIGSVVGAAGGSAATYLITKKKFEKRLTQDLVRNRVPRVCSSGSSAAPKQPDPEDRHTESEQQLKKEENTNPLQKPTEVNPPVDYTASGMKKVSPPARKKVKRTDASKILVNEPPSEEYDLRWQDESLEPYLINDEDEGILFDEYGDQVLDVPWAVHEYCLHLDGVLTGMGPEYDIVRPEQLDYVPYNFRNFIPDTFEPDNEDCPEFIVIRDNDTQTDSKIYLMIGYDYESWCKKFYPARFKDEVECGIFQTNISYGLKS